MSARKKHTPEEIAEAIVYPVNLTAAQKKEATGQLALARKNTQAQMKAKDKLVLQLLQLKFKLEKY